MYGRVFSSRGMRKVCSPGLPIPLGPAGVTAGEFASGASRGGAATGGEREHAGSGGEREADAEGAAREHDAKGGERKGAVIPTEHEGDMQ